MTPDDLSQTAQWLERALSRDTIVTSLTAIGIIALSSAAIIGSIGATSFAILESIGAMLMVLVVSGAALDWRRKRRLNEAVGRLPADNLPAAGETASDGKTPDGDRRAEIFFAHIADHPMTYALADYTIKRNRKAKTPIAGAAPEARIVGGESAAQKESANKTQNKFNKIKYLQCKSKKNSSISPL